MSINSIDLSRFRNTELLQFNHDALSIVLANDPAALKVTDQYNALQTVNETLKTLFITDRGNAITEEIIALDLRRDNAINGMMAYAQSSTYHFDATTNQAATVLNNYFGTYGSGLARQNYASETASLSNILSDLTNKPNLSAAAATLLLGDWLLELGTANTIFNQKYLARTTAYGAESLETMKAKRLEAANTFYDLRNNIDAYFTINKGAEPFAKATNELNALIAQYNVLLAGRTATAVVAPAIVAQPGTTVVAS